MAPRKPRIPAAPTSPAPTTSAEVAPEEVTAIDAAIDAALKGSGEATSDPQTAQADPAGPDTPTPEAEVITVLVVPDPVEVDEDVPAPDLAHPFERVVRTLIGPGFEGFLKKREG